MTKPGDQRAASTQDEDLGFLPDDLRAAATATGETYPAWHETSVEAAVIAIAESGRIVLGLNPRRYNEDGSFVEAAWGDGFEGDDPEASRRSALESFENARDRIPDYNHFQIIWGESSRRDPPPGTGAGRPV